MSLPFTPATPAEGSDNYYHQGVVFDGHASASPNHIQGYVNGGEAHSNMYQSTDAGAVSSMTQDEVDTAFGISVMFQFIS